MEREEERDGRGGREGERVGWRETMWEGKGEEQNKS